MQTKLTCSVDTIIIIAKLASQLMCNLSLDGTSPFHSSLFFRNIHLLEFFYHKSCTILWLFALRFSTYVCYLYFSSNPLKPRKYKMKHPGLCKIYPILTFNATTHKIKIERNFSQHPTYSPYRNHRTSCNRSENCRKWVLANRHSRNWELYSSRLHMESYNTPHWSDRQTGFPRILWYESIWNLANQL